MDLISVRIITHDVARLVAFYEHLTARQARWAADEFAEVVSPSCALAISSARAMERISPGAGVAESNRSVILEFRVDDVDRERDRLAAHTPDLQIVQEPTTMPWGNRSMLLRDPDGNLVNLFAPLSEAARARFAR